MQPLPEPDGPDRHTLTVAVQDADLDELGHVNNVVYLRWVEDVARAHASAVGAGLTRMLAEKAVVVVREHLIRYHRPALPGETLLVSTVVTDQRGVRAFRHNRVQRRSGELLVEVRTEWVWVNPDSGRPRVPPPALLACYAVGAEGSG